MLGGDEAAASLRVGGGRRDLPILQRRVGAGTRAAATMTRVMSSHTRSTATVSIATTARDLASGPQRVMVVASNSGGFGGW
jgi:hypothetical protein